MKHTLMLLLNEISSAVDYVYNQQKRNEMASLISSLPNFKSVEDNLPFENEFVIFSNKKGDLIEGYVREHQAYNFSHELITKDVLYFYNGEKK